MLYDPFHHFPHPPIPTVHHSALQGFLTKQVILTWTKNMLVKPKWAIHPLRKSNFFFLWKIPQEIRPQQVALKGGSVKHIISVVSRVACVENI